MITKKCRDCGREFTLNDSEINFYRSKGFELPSRCKACRDKRKGRQAPSSAASPTSRHTPPPKKPNLPAYLLVLILAVGLVFTAVTKLTDAFITSELPQTSAVTENVTSALTTAEISADTSASQASQQETEIITSSETSAEYTTTTAETTATVPQTTAAAAASAPSPHFRNEERLNEHYEKHGIEMGFATPAEYEAAAAAVVNSPDALHKLEKEDGDDVYYIESTNEFVIVSTDGYIRTYYNPTNGKEYFDNQ
ncbi:zinc-ribbon domain containing protein [Huintestinicola sp.]